MTTMTNALPFVNMLASKDMQKLEIRRDIRKSKPIPPTPRGDVSTRSTKSDDNDLDVDDTDGLSAVTGSRKGAATTTPPLSSSATTMSDKKKTLKKEFGKDYYGGFVTRGIADETTERISGDALLGPTFKFVGGFSLIIGALFLFFMVSNGLL